MQVCILDFDLHHGNGTAAIFSRDPSVLFVDIHEASSIYPPPHESGAAEDIGEGAGRGTTINVPLPREWVCCRCWDGRPGSPGSAGCVCQLLGCVEHTSSTHLCIPVPAHLDLQATRVRRVC